MGIVVHGPWRHARASSNSAAGCRAAKAVRASAFRPAATALSVIKMADHHSAGTLSRCHHFETADALASKSIARKSTAIASLDGHKSMIERNDKSVMPTSVGHSVLKSKDLLSLDCELPLGHTVPMAKKMLTDFECCFLARTYAARKLRYNAGEDIAPKLQDNMRQDGYKQYETRGPLPHELIDRFLDLTGVTYEWLFTGRGPGPAWQDRYEILRNRQRRPKKTKKQA